MKKIKGAIFDLDGTLLDTIPDLKIAINEAGKFLGYKELNREDILPHFGNGVYNLFNGLFPIVNGNDELLNKALDIYQKKYDECCTVNTKKYDGIDDVLDYLVRKGIKLAVFSNKPDKSVKEIIAFYFPNVKFEIVLGQRKGYPVKPDPKSLDDIFSAFNLHANEVVEIGDGRPDFLLTKNTGMQHISCLWGYNPKELLMDVGAKNFAKTPDEIKRYL